MNTLPYFWLWISGDIKFCIPNRNQPFILLSETINWFLYKMQHWGEMSQFDNDLPQ